MADFDFAGYRASRRRGAFASWMFIIIGLMLIVDSSASWIVPMPAGPKVFFALVALGIGGGIRRRLRTPPVREALLLGGSSNNIITPRMLVEELGLEPEFALATVKAVAAHGLGKEASAQNPQSGAAADVASGMDAETRLER